MGQTLAGKSETDRFESETDFGEEKESLLREANQNPPLKTLRAYRLSTSLRPRVSLSRFLTLRMHGARLMAPCIFVVGFQPAALVE